MLPPLATTADLAQLLGRELTEDEATRAQALIKGASARVRRYTRRRFAVKVSDDVVHVVCAMVLRTLLSPSQADGMVSERIGQYNYQLQQGAGTAGATVRMSADDREALAPYRRTAGTIRVRAR